MSRQFLRFAKILLRSNLSQIADHRKIFASGCGPHRKHLGGKIWEEIKIFKIKNIDTDDFAFRTAIKLRVNETSWFN